MDSGLTGARFSKSEVCTQSDLCPTSRTIALPLMPAHFQHLKTLDSCIINNLVICNHSNASYGYIYASPPKFKCPIEGPRSGEYLKDSMTDILENKRYFRQSNLCAKEVIVVVLQFLVREMIPPM